MTWDEAKTLIVQVIKTPGEARTVKLTLIGRPQKIIAQQACVVVSLKGKEPPSLPKGLPPVPEGSTITWAVFIVNKQWNKVKASIEQNQDDQLIIEGYPLVGKNGVAAVMATNCKSEGSAMRAARAVAGFALAWFVSGAAIGLGLKSMFGVDLVLFCGGLNVIIGISALLLVLRNDRARRSFYGEGERGGLALGMLIVMPVTLLLLGVLWWLLGKFPPFR
jgi:hypothetical protein